MNYGNDREERVKKATKQRGGKGKEKSWKCITDRHHMLWSEIGGRKGCYVMWDFVIM